MLNHLIAAALALTTSVATAGSLQQCGSELLTETGHEDRTQTMLSVAASLSSKHANVAAAVLMIGILETGLNPHPAHGAAGEVGTFQVLPSNLPWLAERCGIRGDPENVVVNAKLAACLLDSYLQQSDGDIGAAVAAYNAGPRAIKLVRDYKPLPRVTSYYLWRFQRMRERTSCSNQFGL